MERHIFLLLALIAYFGIQVSECNRSNSSMYCYGRHMTSAWLDRYTCCNYTYQNSSYTPMGYAECFVSAENKNENYTTAIWRIYSCIMSKRLPTTENKMTLTKFAKIITANFSSEIKRKILEEVALRKDAAISFPLTDYAEFSRIRATYYNVEKHVCGASNAVAEENWGTCDRIEEMVHRGGRCCGKTPLPTLDYPNPRTRQYAMSHNISKCDTIFADTFKKFSHNNKTLESIFRQYCAVACALIEDKVILLETLKKLNQNTKLKIDDIALKFVPVYYSPAVGKQVQSCLKMRFNLTDIWNRHAEAETHLPNAELLFPCGVYYQIYSMVATCIYEPADCLEKQGPTTG